MDATIQKPELVLSFDDVRQLVQTLGDQLRGVQFDFMLGISRGGVFPAGLLAKRLDCYDLRVISVQHYDKQNHRLPHPILIQAPPEEVLIGKRVLIVDEVWDSGHSIALVKKYVARANGTPIVATLHYKPSRSEVQEKPDYYAALADSWIRYPWE